MNLHNKKGNSFQVTKKDLEKLYKKQEFSNLMDWVEQSLTYTKMIVSPQFFAPTFTKLERDIIVSLIYSVYPNVKNIEPLDKDGVIITCDDYLDKDKVQTAIDNM